MKNIKEVLIHLDAHRVQLYNRYTTTKTLYDTYKEENNSDMMLVCEYQGYFDLYTEVTKIICDILDVEFCFYVSETKEFLEVVK